jgi:hypothetical protein
MSNNHRVDVINYHTRGMMHSGGTAMFATEAEAKEYCLWLGRAYPQPQPEGWWKEAEYVGVKEWWAPHILEQA